MPFHDHRIVKIEEARAAVCFEGLVYPRRYHRLPYVSSSERSSRNGVLTRRVDSLCSGFIVPPDTHKPADNDRCEHDKHPQIPHQENAKSPHGPGNLSSPRQPGQYPTLRNRDVPIARTLRETFTITSIIENRTSEINESIHALKGNSRFSLFSLMSKSG